MKRPEWYIRIPKEKCPWYIWEGTTIDKCNHPDLDYPLCEQDQCPIISRRV